MQDSNPEGLWNPISSRLNACWQTDWAIEDQAKNLNSTARPYDQQAFSPPDPTAIWHSHLALAIYIFVVVNFDALAQASDFRIERRQVVFLCWMQDSNPEGLWALNTGSRMSIDITKIHLNNCKHYISLCQIHRRNLILNLVLKNWTRHRRWMVYLRHQHVTTTSCKAM